MILQEKQERNIIKKYKKSQKIKPKKTMQSLETKENVKTLEPTKFGLRIMETKQFNKKGTPKIVSSFVGHDGCF